MGYGIGIGQIDKETQMTDTATRARPEYGREFVDELPEETSNRGQSGLFVDLLQPLVDDEANHGRWALVATYHTPNGASQAYKAIVEGTRAVPVAAWEFEVRRFNDEEDGGKRKSRLYARVVDVKDNGSEDDYVDEDFEADAETWDEDE